MPKREKFEDYKKRQSKKMGQGLQLTDCNDLMNFAAKPGVALPETFEECGERRM